MVLANGHNGKPVTGLMRRSKIGFKVRYIDRRTHGLQHGGAFEKAEPGKAEGLTPRFGAYASERYLTKKHLMG